MFKSHSFIFMMIVLVQARHQPKAPKVEEIDKKINDRIEEENENFDDTERRFMDNLNDANWHIAHLKSTDFENTRRVGEENCKEETLTEKVRRYRKSLKNDAGRVEYVYANPLPVSEKDLDEYKCVSKDKKEITDNKSVKGESVNKTDTATNKTTKADAITKNGTVTSTNITDADEAKVEVEGRVTLSDDEDASLKPIATNVKKPHIINQATTKTASEIQKDRDARRGDYLFSSVEYDDDVADFDKDECPDAVEIITLEQDIIRPYDVECELSLQWQSLE